MLDKSPLFWYNNVMNTNYKIEFLTTLLDETCVLSRYYPLIPLKMELLCFLKSRGVKRKNDCLQIAESVFLNAQVLSAQQLALFKAFLCLYDVNPSKLNEISKLPLTAEEKKAFTELYALPGVKQTRATLYFKAGIATVAEVAVLSAEELIAKCADVIGRENLPFKPPLVKEAKTHIAVAKAFTQ